MTRILTSIGLIVVLALAACRSGGSVSGKPRVVATTTIIGDMVRNVAGDRAEVTVLLAPGVDPHEYDPAPADVTALAEARVVFANGAGLEKWLPRLADSAGAAGKVRTVSEGLALRTLEENGIQGNDPHLWFDVRNAIHYVEQVRDGLSAVDAANTDAYRANAGSYIDQLKELDAWIAKQIEVVPVSQRLLVTNHDTFGYFAARYGFTIVGTVFPTGGAEASPSAQAVADLINTIKTTGVKAVFTENTLNPDVANTVAKDAGVKVVSALYTDSLGPADSPAATYIDLMRYDVQTIVEALK